MKVVRQTGTFLLSILIAFCISSCSGDDDPTTPTPTPVADKIELPATENTKPVFNAEGGTATVTFTASKAWTATAVNTRADDWLTISPTSGNAGVATLTIKTAANETPDDRSATITLKSGTASQNINVTQKQKDALTICSDKIEVDAEGGEIGVEVKANIDFSVKTDVDWITQADTRAMKTTNLSFNVSANDDSEKREGHITISSGAFSEKITVYQAANVPTLVLTKNDFAVSAEGGDITVEVRSNVDVSVKMPDAKWISESSTRSMSTHTYVFTIDKNEGYDNRTAEIIFFNKANNLSEKVTITQMQLNAIIVALNEYTISSKGGELDFDVQTNVEISVSIEADWITQVDTRALRTETLHFDIAANDGLEDRTGIINITDGELTQSITITQKGYNEEIEKERQALMDLFNATDGPHWKNNENWGSNKPVGEWYGVDKYGQELNLYLSDNGLCGSIPESIGNLANLMSLNLQSNQLTGQIPESIGNLANLISLQISGNQLTESIPESIGNLSKLKDVNFMYNQLTGSIPESIGNLQNLKSLWLNNNQLTGSIPESIGNLVNLDYLILGDNQLTGSIPESIRNLVNIEYMQLHQNQLSGQIPQSIGNLKKLESLWLGDNQLTGPIPESIGNLVNLNTLNLPNNKLSGSIPESIGNLVNLEYLNLENNLFTGSIPGQFCNLTALKSLILDTNEGITGSFPENIGNLSHLRYIYCQECPNFGGQLPNSFCNLTELEGFYAAFSNFSGNLPENFGNLSSLEDIRMCANHLSGPLPESIGNLKNLKILMIRWNELSGDLPASMGNMSNLENIYLEGNKLTGGIPDSFMNLSNLKWLSVSGNCMDGSISEKMYQSAWWSQVFTSIAQRPGHGLKIGNAYTSTDFSKNGEVTILQRHTKGKGISLVITGDGFSDRLISDGTFGGYVKKAVGYFFDKEPYASFKDYFDIYSVAAVSRNDIIGLETAFETKVYGDKFNYNLNSISNYVAMVPDLGGNLADVTTLVIVNDAGNGSRVNCHMYSDGFAIGLCTVSDDMKAEINHEIGGHGFAKLADEYWSDDNSGSTFTNKADLDNYHKRGWYINVDYENDPQKVLWKDFISNTDYKVENIGIYEGGFADYTYGIYRPTEYSIMRSNVGEYNAPSRWAIYKRIKELAGESCTFKDFLAYDKKSLERIAKEANTRSYVEKIATNIKTSKQGAPPIIYDYPSNEIGMH